MKKLVFLSLLIVLLISSSFSSDVFGQIASYKNRNYQPLNSKDGIEFYYKYQECVDAATGDKIEEIIIKVTNTTNKDIELSWDLETWYNETCFGCRENDNNHFSISLKAGESKEGSCETRLTNKALIIFSMYLNRENKSVYTKCNLKNITTKNLN